MVGDLSKRDANKKTSAHPGFLRAIESLVPDLDARQGTGDMRRYPESPGYCDYFALASVTEPVSVSNGVRSGVHVPDGFLTVPTSVATGVVAAVAVGLALRGARRELDERTAPMAGLVATFVFAAQMLNFPVGAGTSGHLLGGALAAVLVGPWTATLCLSVVLIVQALLFADGGITALGTNIVLMGLVGVWVAWGGFRLARKLLPNRSTMVPLAGAIAAFVSVPAAAITFSALFVVGGAVPIAPAALFATMGAVHLLIGIGEAVITTLIISSVVAIRPDLVHGARGLIRQRPLVIKQEVRA